MHKKQLYLKFFLFYPSKMKCRIDICHYRAILGLSSKGADTPENRGVSAFLIFEWPFKNAPGGGTPSISV
jgi:hypothetical protein